MSKLKIFHDADRGQSWAVRIVEPGDSYGLDNCLINNHDDTVMVEFYDTRYEFTDYGQFVSRYLIESLEGHDGGLCLQGGIPSWQIEEACMGRVRQWLQDIQS